MSFDRDVAIVFDDLTEFYSIKDSIDELINSNVKVDLYVLGNYSNGMSSETERRISSLGYEVLTDFTGENRYKVLLEPYPLINGDNVHYDYRIKYRYSPVCAKPDPVYTPEWNMPYDAFIVYSNRDAEVFSVYGKTHTIPYKKFSNFKKETVKGKPELLYLPTYGDVSSVDMFDKKTADRLKEKYNLTIKSHHAIQYRDDEKHNYEKLKALADNFYDSDTSIVELLSTADIVLSDNSGAIFDAIYSETPIALLSDVEKLNSRKLGEIDTLQYELVKNGVVPCAHRIEDVEQVLSLAYDLLPEQKEVKLNIFGIEAESESMMEVIDYYLSKNKDDDLHLKSKHILQSSWYEGNASKEARELFAQENATLKRDVKMIYSQFEESISWRITRPVRSVSSLIKRIYK